MNAIRVKLKYQRMGIAHLTAIARIRKLASPCPTSENILIVDAFYSAAFSNFTTKHFYDGIGVSAVGRMAVALQPVYLIHIATMGVGDARESSAPNV